LRSVRRLGSLRYDFVGSPGPRSWHVFSPFPFVVNSGRFAGRMAIRGRLCSRSTYGSFFKNLTAETVKTEGLVADLMALVQDTENLLRETGAALAQESREQILTKLEGVKACTAKLREQAAAGARATDRVIREHPYASLGCMLLTGMVIGVLACRKR